MGTNTHHDRETAKAGGRDEGSNSKENVEGGGEGDESEGPGDKGGGSICKEVSKAGREREEQTREERRDARAKASRAGQQETQTQEGFIDIDQIVDL